MIKDVIKQSNTLYKENFHQLISNLAFAVIVYCFFAQLWDHYESVSENVGLVLSITANIILMAIESVITLTAINIFLKRSPFQSITPKTVFVYFFTYSYISIASILGLALFIIPGLLIVSSSILFQIFILNNGDSPMQSIENSIELLRGKLFKVTTIIIAVYIPICLFVFLLAWLALQTGEFYNITSFIFEVLIQLTTSFYWAAMVVTIYNYCSQQVSD